MTNPAEVINECRRAGVQLHVSPSGKLVYWGDTEAVNRMLPILRQHKVALLAALNVPTANDAGIDLERYARDIARANRITPAQALELLDDTDRQAIAAGDAAYLRAWRVSTRLAVEHETFPPVARQLRSATD